MRVFVLYKRGTHIFSTNNPNTTTEESATISLPATSHSTYYQPTLANATLGKQTAPPQHIPIFSTPVTDIVSGTNTAKNAAISPSTPVRPVATQLSFSTPPNTTPQTALMHRMQQVQQKAVLLAQPLPSQPLSFLPAQAMILQPVVVSTAVTQPTITVTHPAVIATAVAQPIFTASLAKPGILYI